ncbi:hypothetical protein wTpre_415, partial [Wolbachia endosymbiont of Trichogramma pretiosum]
NKFTDIGVAKFKLAA